MKKKEGKKLHHDNLHKMKKILSEVILEDLREEGLKIPEILSLIYVINKKFYY